MAVVFTESFDHLTRDQLQAKGWSLASGTMVPGRFGGQALRSLTSGIQSHALPGAYTTLILNGAFQHLTLPTPRELIATFASATKVCRLFVVTVGPNKVLQLQNAAGTVLGTGTTPLVVNTWYQVQIKTVVSTTVGAVELRLNGLPTPEIIAAGVNTGLGAINNVGLIWVNAEVLTWDDLSAVDSTGSAPTNDFVGDSKLEIAPLAAEGANPAWTANTGTKVAAVDDSPSHDADVAYISDATPGDRETFTLGALSVAGGTVYAVQVNVVARKDDALARTIAPVIRQGGVNYDGITTPGLSSTYLVYSQLYDRLGPDGNPWTPAIVAAMEVGVKEVA